MQFQPCASPFADQSFLDLQSSLSSFGQRQAQQEQQQQRSQRQLHSQDDPEESEDSGFVLVPAGGGGSAAGRPAQDICRVALQAGIMTMPQRIPALPSMPLQEVRTLLIRAA
jgi:hypothetical protein